MNRIILSIIIGLFSQLVTSQHSLSEKYNLMPWPQKIQENNSNFKINEALTITILGNDSKERVDKAATTFLRRLSGRTGIFIDKHHQLFVLGNYLAVHINLSANARANIKHMQTHHTVADHDDMSPSPRHRACKLLK